MASAFSSVANSDGQEGVAQAVNYTEKGILQVLLAGVGPIAEAHHLASGDPIRVENVLIRFSKTFQMFLKIHYGFDLQKNEKKSNSHSRQGTVGAEVHVVAYATAFVNAGLYANVAVATLVLVAGAAVLVAVVAPGSLKSDDSTMPNFLESETIIVRISEFFEKI